jgi:hypothetical protein
MKVALEVKPPMMPNFIAVGDQRVHVANLTGEQVEEFIALWAATFRAHVEKMRRGK